MSKHIEAEGGELLIETSNGYKAIIPKNMAEWVKEHIKSGNHAAVDHYVKGLKELKPGKKAQDGMKIGPPDNKTEAQASTTQIARPVQDKIAPNKLPFLNSVVKQEKPGTPGVLDFIKKEYDRYSNNGRDRTFLDVGINFLPFYEQFVDVKDIVTGIRDRDREKINSGTLGMLAPLAGKAILSGQDWLNEKVLGKEEADKMAKRRNAIVNMSENELAALFKKYGYGGYDKWEAEGFPSLK
jgi:hypothetical protein